MWLILVADLTMSIDNILAVAAASKGNMLLLIFGLGLSIPFVIFTSSLLSRIMDRFPIVVYIGAAILGRVGGDMMITDPWVHNLLHPSQTVENRRSSLFRDRGGDRGQAVFPSYSLIRCYLGSRNARNSASYPWPPIATTMYWRPFNE